MDERQAASMLDRFRAIPHLRALFAIKGAILPTTPRQFAGAMLVERIEQKLHASDPSPVQCSLISRWRMQPFRLAVDHEQKEHPLDLDGILFDPDEYDGLGNPIGADR